MRSWQKAIGIDVEHTDCTGLVYHAKYLNFLESACSQVLRDCCQWLARDVKSLYQSDGFFVVHSVNIKYLKPLRLDDEAVVTSRCRQLSPVRTRGMQTIHSPCVQLRYVEAEIDCVFVGKGMRPCKMPQWLIEKIEEALS